MKVGDIFRVKSNSNNYGVTKVGSIVRIEQVFDAKNPFIYVKLLNSPINPFRNYEGQTMEILIKDLDIDGSGLVEVPCFEHFCYIL